MKVITTFVFPPSNIDDRSRLSFSHLQRLIISWCLTIFFSMSMWRSCWPWLHGYFYFPLIEFFLGSPFPGAPEALTAVSFLSIEFLLESLEFDKGWLCPPLDNLCSILHTSTGARIPFLPRHWAIFRRTVMTF